MTAGHDHRTDAQLATTVLGDPESTSRSQLAACPLCAARVAEADPMDAGAPDEVALDRLATVAREHAGIPQPVVTALQGERDVEVEPAQLWRLECWAYREAVAEAIERLGPLRESLEPSGPDLAVEPSGRLLDQTFFRV